MDSDKKLIKQVMFDTTNKDFCMLTNVKNMPGVFRDISKDILNNDYLRRQETTESNARSYPRKLPFALEQAKGIFLKDVDGNVYYDCLSCAGALALGHNHEVTHKAINRELINNLPMLTLDITTPVKEAFVNEIISCLPKEFAENAKIQFCGPSGSDAVEAAIKLVKIATGRSLIMAFQGGYHGMTNGSLNLMGNTSVKNAVPGSIADVHFLPYPYMYRCPMGSVDDPDSQSTIRYIENLLNDIESGVTKPAGIIVEAIQGEGGMIPAPNQWMKELRRITKEQGIPLIVDEVQTGLGRTGKFFAFEHSGIVPDVIVLSKAIGGSLPLAVVIYSKKLDKWEPGTHAGTFRGNQLAMATGTATIRYIKANKLHEQAARMGDLFIKEFIKIQNISGSIGDVRGKGLMIGVEIVNKSIGLNKSGRPESFKTLTLRIQHECFSRGLVLETGGRHSSVLRFMPPLTITEQQVKHICEIFQQAILAAENFIDCIKPIRSKSDVRSL
ncbi:MAG: diaminobutyrate--2-oxoglutarate transaminase [Methyloglobulus sp.]|nr:diaminobutyrate--2-oxoglutarate transaminase [Methyloglobulus sp.]